MGSGRGAGEWGSAVDISQVGASRVHNFATPRIVLEGADPPLHPSSSLCYYYFKGGGLFLFTFSLPRRAQTLGETRSCDRTAPRGERVCFPPSPSFYNAQRCAQPRGNSAPPGTAERRGARGDAPRRGAGRGDGITRLWAASPGLLLAGEAAREVVPSQPATFSPLAHARNLVGGWKGGTGREGGLK